MTSLVWTTVLLATAVATSPGYVELPVSAASKSVHAGPDLQERIGKRDGHIAPLALNNSLSFYTAEVFVGNPAQRLQLLVDTGSSDMWVLAKDNPYCNTFNGSIPDDDDYDMSIQKQAVFGIDSNSLNANYRLDQVQKSINLDLSPLDSRVTKVKVSPDGKVDCQTSGLFDFNASSTWKFNDTDKGFSIRYGDYTFAKGRWGTDQVSFGNLTINETTIGLGEKANSSQGVLGIGLPGIESTVIRHNGSLEYSYENFPMQLKRQGLIKSNTYSLWLNDASAQDGKIIFGGVDHHKYSGQLQTVPLVDRYNRSRISELTVVLNELNFTDCMNNTSPFFASNTSVPILLDSGTSFTYLPSKLVDSIMDSFHAGYVEDIGFHVLPCSVGENDAFFTFGFSGVDIKVPLKRMLVPLTVHGGKPAMLDKGQGQGCALAILPTRTHRMILGDNFLRSAYVVFDLDNLEVSLANAAVNTSRSFVEPIGTCVPGARKAELYEEGRIFSYNFTVLPATNFSLTENGTLDYSDIRFVEEAPEDASETLAQGLSMRSHPSFMLLVLLASATLVLT